MRRTYKSKKDAGDALDPKDVKSCVDEKSSAFDAFYIKNIKHTKRELSCVGSTNYHCLPGNKVRKKKYVKRVIRDVEQSFSESITKSTYLTPDKSIRVNKAPDIFDQLFNSTISEKCKSIKSTLDRLQTKRTKNPKSTPNNKLKYSKQYIKKINCSDSDSDDYDKENKNEENKSKEISNNPQDLTDIWKHDLIIEETNSKQKSHNESINNILNKMYNKATPVNNNKNVSSQYVMLPNHRLTENFMSPVRDSPLTSTPCFKKYRGKSIYRFSPISIGDKHDKDLFIKNIDHSVNIEEHNVEKYGSKDIESRLAQSISFKNASNELTSVNSWDRKKILKRDSSSDSPTHKNEVAAIEHLNSDNKLLQVNIPEQENKGSTSNLGISTIPEPFLGFSIDNVDNELIILKENGPHNSTFTGIPDYRSPPVCTKLLMDFSNVGSQLNANRTIANSSQHLNNGTNYKVNGNENPGYLNQSTEWSGAAQMKNSPDTNMSFSRESISKESFYDACSNLSSDKSSLTEHCKQKQLFVHVEKMNDSYFKYLYDKMLVYPSTISDNKSCTSILENLENSRTSVKIFHENSTDPNIVIEESKFEKCNNSLDIIVNNEANNDNDKLRKYSNSGKEYCSDVSDNLQNSNSSNESNFVYKPVDTMENEFDVDYNTSETIDNDETDKIPKKSFSSSNNEYCSDEIEIFNYSTASDDRLANYKLKNISPNIVTVETEEYNSLLIDSDDSSFENNKQFSGSDNENTCFVTTRRRNVTTTYSPIYVLDNSSASSGEYDKTVLPLTSAEITNSRSSDNAVLKTGIRFSKDDVHYENNAVIEKCKKSQMDSSFKIPTVNLENKKNGTSDSQHKPSIVLQPGKKWERSLSIYRRMTIVNDNFDLSLLDEESLDTKGRKYRQSVIDTMELQDSRVSTYNDSHIHLKSTIVPKSCKPTVTIIKEPNASRLSICTSKYELSGFLSEECDDTLLELSKLSIADAEHDITVLEKQNTCDRVATARDYVLRRCNQTDAILFDECYPEPDLKNCHKIGEGVYGEVFLWRARDGRARVLKVVPIAGITRVNGETQKDFHEIISEIVIAMELSALRAPIADIDRHFDEGKDISTLDLHSIENATDCFNEVLAVKCVYGSYPSRLLDLWDLYDECKGSENDNPAILPIDQQFIILELANAGLDLESFQFNSAEQAYSLFIQVAFGLAVGEEAFQFEHRDLHWGNVLISPTDQKLGTYVLRGRAHRVPRCGVHATIIDYSLSRLSLPLGAASDHAALYNDLANDEGLFDAIGDYQFQVYRLMRDKLGNDWKNFEPYTNILWLHYTVDKMITALRYKRINTKIHKQYITKLKGIENRILNYGSAIQFVLTDNEY